jgi:ABC-2 type transport system ATP-binding protein
MPERRPTISLMHLSKSFHAIHALDDLCLDVDEGIFGLIGPNGSGKTTLLRTVLGLIKPDNGTGRIFGFDIVKDSYQIRKRVGVLHERQLYPRNLRVLRFLTHIARIYHSYESPARLLALVGLQDASKRKIGQLSAGMLQRLGIAQALIGNPELVFLDEPTSNLDVLGREDVLRLITEIHHELGTSFFISSHVLPELEKICGSVGFLKNGRIIAKGPTMEIIESFTSGYLRIISSDSRELRNMIQQIECVGNLSVIGDNTLTLSMSCGSIASLATQIRSLAAQRDIKIYAIEQARSLDEAFKAVMR